MQKPKLEQLKNTFTFAAHTTSPEDLFEASVLAPLIEVNGEVHLLFEQRAPGIRQGGEVCFPGGRVEPTDPSPLDTALRETCEELGCYGSTIEPIGRLPTQHLSYGSVVHAYLGSLTHLPEPEQLEKEEVASTFTLPLAYFMENEPEVYHCKVYTHPYTIDAATGEKNTLLPAKALGLPAYYHEPWGGKDHPILLWHTQPAPVWGLTAKIVHDLIKQLRANGY